MPKIAFVHVDSIAFKRSGDPEGTLRPKHAASAASARETVPNGAETRWHLQGDDDAPQLFEVRFPPNAAVAPHAHAEDEVLHVLEGELRFGKQAYPAGSTVSVPGNTLYAFTAGPDGARFLNFRPRADYTNFTKEEFAQRFARGDRSTDGG
jgi:quercetin dioxygenase-like cupin family protein